MPHSTTHITQTSNTATNACGRLLRWDNNGNLAQQTIYSVNNNVPTYQTMRMLFWDEDDRLNLVAGDGYLSYYAYGHDGNRAIKMTGNAAIDQTGTLLNSTNLENITIYPNEYLTVTQAEYTKYYYAGGNRIASKIGTGGFEKMTRLCTEDLFFSGNANTLFGNALQQIVNITNQPNDEFPVNVCGGYSVATELLADPLPNFYINSLNLNFTQNNLLQQFRQNLTNSVEPVYYFHSDHLGSANLITTATAAPVQFMLHLPYGEEFIKQLNSTYDERFTFTGKEKDIETGYYYFGARFDNVDLGFMSVDPMADKYPSMSPYAYCAWNPVKFIDLTGRNFDEPQRRAAIARAIEYEKANRVDPSQKSGRGNSKNTYSNGAKGKPGEKVDCSGLTSECIKAGGEVDPVGKYSGSGVQQTVKGSEKLSNIEFAEEGNLIVFNNQTHIGIIIEINYDQDGIISSFIIIHSSGRPERGFSGPHYETIPAKGTKDWKIDGIYKWDTRPDISVQLKDVIVKGTKIEE